MSNANADADAVAVIVFSIVIFGLCLLFIISARLREHNEALREAEEDVASRERKEYVSTELNVKEWSPCDPPVESTEGAQDTPPSGEVVEAPQPPAPPTNSSPASYVMRSDDCESSLAGEEEMAGCAICLSQFKPHQLVCESNNSSCQHVFHKDCMVDWLTNHHDDCPMCREVYLLKTV
jgi:hypothetical protein